jgi:hypothetical protein
MAAGYVEIPFDAWLISPGQSSFEPQRHQEHKDFEQEVAEETEKRQFKTYFPLLSLLSLPKIQSGQFFMPQGEAPS